MQSPHSEQKRFFSTAFHIMSVSEFPHVMPRCLAAMGILGGVSKVCCLVEDSLRHLRCRGMTSQGFSLEIPILTSLGGMMGGNNSVA